MIACRPVSFTAITGNSSVQAQVKPLADADPKKPPFRFVDSRLQALRKRGLIKFSVKSGWSAVKQPDADKPATAL